MLRRAKTQAEKMIKVDHAGENGAVNIYRAQRIVSYLRKPSLVKKLRHFQEHEEEHRDIFRNQLDRYGVRRCVSYHACGLGGFTLGFVTGLIGPKAIAATTYAVESTVLEHLHHQMKYLSSAPQEGYEAVKAIYDDEKAHHDEGQRNMGDGLIDKALVRIVKACTQAVILFGMR